MSRPPLPRGCRPRAAVPGLLALLLWPLLAGCNGSRFGDTLSRSFSAPAAGSGPAAAAAGSAASGSPAAAATSAPPAGSAAASTATPGTATPGTAAPSRPAAVAAAARPTAGSGEPGTATGRPGSPATNATPGGAGSASAPGGARSSSAAPRSAPYRVTILLPSADASAPAEVVTEALRAAGVPFEVETIERLSRPGGNGAPVSRPAPEPR